MELVSLAQEMLQDVAEHAASYRLGQTVLRYMDRILWAVEKCARWAVPPPLDQDERPQPELVRPLPWVFFLALLVALRVIRESISLLNLVLGKPPLRSADVVTYIQGKRRYLRTLKYQGNRMMRARSESAPRQSWLSSTQSLLEFTMCFRRQPQYGNNNTTRLSNNDEVLVVKRNKRGGQEVAPTPATNETTMERLIEKIMIDLDAESDDDSSFTLTNVTSVRSDQSGYNTESDQDASVHVHTSTPNNINFEASTDISSSLEDTPNNSMNVEATAINSKSFETKHSMSKNHEKTSTTNNGSSISSDTDLNESMSPERLEMTSDSSETENTLKNEDLSKLHSDENGDVKMKQQKIANGRANTSPSSNERERTSSGNEAY